MVGDTLEDFLRRNQFSLIRTGLLRAVNYLLTAIEQKLEIPGLHIESSKSETLTKLNGLSMMEGLRGMLKGKNFRTVDMVAPSFEAVVEKITGYIEIKPLT